MHLSGCFFHLCQSLLRKVSELGLEIAYDTNHDMALALKMFPDGLFVRHEDIGKSYS